MLAIAVGLSMDAFAVSIGKGLTVDRAGAKHAAIAGLYFGGFQMLMPLAGFLLGSGLGPLIAAYDHWIAFALLAFIGARMIKEARSDEERVDSSFEPSAMLPLAVATSIDALAVGVSFAFLRVDIVPAVGIIGATTFILSAAGLKLGNAFGSKHRSLAELAGGLILIGMGLKILLEHLGVLG